MVNFVVTNIERKTTLIKKDLSEVRSFQEIAHKLGKYFHKHLT